MGHNQDDIIEREYNEITCRDRNPPRNEGAERGNDQTKVPENLSGSGGPHKVLIVDDSAANRELLRRTLEPEGFDAFLVPTGEVAIQVARRVRPTLILMDVRMPGGLNGFETCARLKEDPATQSIPIIFITVDDDEEAIVQGFEAGGVDYIAKPFKEREVVARVRSQTRIKSLTEALRRKNAELEAEAARRKQAETDRDRADKQLDSISLQELAKWGLASFVGRSPAVTRVIEDIRKLQTTTTSTSILILGESGTGKELIARAIHFGGTRGKGPFIAMNCSAIPAELAESTLFGHVQGAFTGAKTGIKGWFELADGGTLFLDEIGDMPLALQSKVLRVLEDGLITPVGGTQPRKVAVRVVAATHRNLAREIRLGHFREDLYFRLARFVVHVPALRERSGDVPLLLHHFVKTLASEMGLPSSGITVEALRTLEAYHFPGNVRELKNIIEHALIRSGGMIEPRDLPPLEPLGTRPNMPEKDLSPTVVPGSETPRQPERSELPPASNLPLADNSNILPHEQERLIFLGTISAAGGDLPSAAEALGVGVDRVHEVLPDLRRTTTKRNEKADEERVREFLSKFGSISNAECCELLELPGDRTYAFLNKLVQNGRLSRTGERRWTRYQWVETGSVA